MFVGYARVSTSEQNLDLQTDALTKAGCKETFKDRISGSLSSRPELEKALQYLRDNEGDTLVVWKLDRLGRNIRDLINIVSKLEERKIGFKCIEERARGRKGGRPFKLNDSKKKHALELYRKKEKSINEICELVGISKPTLFRYIRRESI